MEVTRREVVLGAGALLVALVIRLRSIIGRLVLKNGEYDGLDDVVSFSARKIAGIKFVYRCSALDSAIRMPHDGQDKPTDRPTNLPTIRLFIHNAMQPLEHWSLRRRILFLKILWLPCWQGRRC